MSAGKRSSGERFRQPGGAIWRERKGEGERRGRPSYRHWEESKRARIKAGLSEGLLRPFPVREKERDFRGRRRSDWWVRSDWWGPRVSVGREEAEIPFRVRLPGLRAGSSSGPKGSPGPSFIFFFLFFFFFFCFLISFLDFAKKLQINSNHFQKFSKIQSIKVGQ
jgi:hypothetical protein